MLVCYSALHTFFFPFQNNQVHDTREIYMSSSTDENDALAIDGSCKVRTRSSGSSVVVLNIYDDRLRILSWDTGSLPLSISRSHPTLAFPNNASLFFFVLVLLFLHLFFSSCFFFFFLVPLAAHRPFF